MFKNILAYKDKVISYFRIKSTIIQAIQIGFFRGHKKWLVFRDVESEAPE